MQALCALSLSSRNGLSRAVSMNGRVKFLRTRFTCGGSGPSSVTIELSHLATSMTYVFLASKRISACEFILSSFTTLSFLRHGIERNNRKNCLVCLLCSDLRPPLKNGAAHLMQNVLKCLSFSRQWKPMSTLICSSLSDTNRNTNDVT